MHNAVPGGKIREFVAGCRSVAAYGLVRCSSGNVSCRAGKGLMLIKTTRAWISDMTANDVAICRIEDGAVLNGRRSSAETGFHAGILRTRPDVNVVLHFQTPCATAVASMAGRQVNYFVIPEIPFYIGPVAVVPYYPPGSVTLARAVTNAMRKHNLVQLRNHGQVTAACDFRHVIQNAVFFELACEIILKGGNAVRPMGREYARALMDAPAPARA